MVDQGVTAALWILTMG